MGGVTWRNSTPQEGTEGFTTDAPAILPRPFPPPLVTKLAQRPKEPRNLHRQPPRHHRTGWTRPHPRTDSRRAARARQGAPEGRGTQASLHEGEAEVEEGFAVRQGGLVARLSSCASGRAEIRCGARTCGLRARVATPPSLRGTCTARSRPAHTAEPSMPGAQAR